MSENGFKALQKHFVEGDEESEVWVEVAKVEVCGSLGNAAG